MFRVQRGEPGGAEASSGPEKLGFIADHGDQNLQPAWVSLQTETDLRVFPSEGTLPFGDGGYLQGGGDGEGARLDLREQIQEAVRFDLCRGVREVGQNLQEQRESQLRRRLQRVLRYLREELGVTSSALRRGRLQ